MKECIIYTERNDGKNRERERERVRERGGGDDQRRCSVLNQTQRVVVGLGGEGWVVGGGYVCYVSLEPVSVREVNRRTRTEITSMDAEQVAIYAQLACSTITLSQFLVQACEFT